ncbi:Leucine-rich repeats and immunoglobulin-like domains protein 1 [Lonchura striata]|nr:Leucine-rich repeats and immunoglobulin-like domains protein 1 [Lonchura striata domestica]
MPALPRDLPRWPRHLNLSYNKLAEIDPSVFAELLNLQEVRLEHNELSAIPSLGPAASSIRSLHLHHNRIRSIEGSQLQPYVTLETLDLSFNDITEIRNGCFPQGLHIKELFLGSNRISTLEPGAFDSLSRSLLTLRLSKNRITQLPVKAFRLPRLIQLELNRNRIRLIEGLTFQGLDSLEVLKLQRNNISKLTDGAFWGLAKMQVLHLEYNSLTEVNSGSLYGLSSLHQLHLSNNSISRINPDGWSFCQKLHELILSYNNLTRLDEGSLADLGGLHVLRLSHNSIHHIAEGAFRGLKNLRVLELDHNDISGTIEDTNGAFTGLENLSKLTLFGNKIKSVAKKAFSGLEALEHLNLGDNAIRSIQADAFARMRSLRQLHINSDSFLCDCQLKWLPQWLVEKELQSFVVATCAHPESLKSKSIFAIQPESFVCETPSLVHPLEDHVVSVGETVALQCKATGSPPPRITWLKGDQPLVVTERHHFTSGNQLLIVRNVVLEDAGKYTCEMSNTLGTERAHSHVSILQALGCRKDRTTVGIITIAVVCSIVLTSLVWVCIIYQTRKKSEEYSVTNTDETIVPPDVPSYLSSQGTLSERQDVAIGVDTQQPNGHIDSNGMCQADVGRCPDVEAPAVGCRQPKLCISYNKDTWKTEDMADGMLVPDKTGYGLPVVCTECSGSTDSVNVHIYPKDSESLRTVENTQNTHPNALSSREHHRKRGAGTSLLHAQPCNGTLYPSNHDRIRAEGTAGALLADTHGSSQAAAKPSELNNLNLVRASPAGGSLKQLNVLPEISPALLDLQREAEVEQALLHNSTTAQPRDSTQEPKLPNRALD